ncbi:hypothetical protein Pan241w_57860 [Gimesia alba]|uniref:Uncharacterized protein n=1 Tax=Gimesia alba TaxID=2527973 RepID=A0A517RP68_9PLAN|nr:hypothetical protein Pan241w_57860 [Gimesia alba]
MFLVLRNRFGVLSNVQFNGMKYNQNDNHWPPDVYS